MEKGQESKTKSEIRFALRFNAAKAGEETPKVAMYLVDTSGTVERKIAVAKEEKLTIPRNYLKVKDKTVALGPDVEDLKSLHKEMLVRFRVDQISTWEKTGMIHLPKDIWSKWLNLFICLSGRVEKCRPILYYLPSPMQIGFPPQPHPMMCAPICNGVVEIYEQECCCYWPIVIIDINDVIRKLKEIVKVRPPFPPWPPPDHDPDIGPAVQLISGPDPLPIEKSMLRSIKLSQAMSRPQLSIEPNINLMEEIQKLESMPQQEAIKYVQAAEYLHPFLCTCSTRKIGEAVLGPDGRFIFCFLRFPVMLKLGRRCNFRYFYKVKQWQENRWVYIYDGFALYQYFRADETANLKTFFGRACDPGAPDIDTGDKPYVMLEYIGSTPSYQLVSPSQTGDDSLAAAPDNGGLVNPPPASQSDVGQLYNQPWGGTLSLRLRFHEDLQALGAQYYRISIIDGPGGTPQILTTPVSWSKFVFVGGHIQVQSEPLGPNTVGGEVGLYKIPYGTDWLWFQYHNAWNTTGFSDGRHMVMIEIFDATGKKLKPLAATGPGTPKDFNFLRWIDSTNTLPVPYTTLLHLFWADNLPCYADIEDLRMNGIPNVAECQYMSGVPTSTFSAGFRAFHATVNSATPPETFMLYYTIWYHRGLNGPNVTIETVGTNQPSTLSGGLPAVSTPQSFASMLGNNRKCTFALNLRAYAKHTNGSRRLNEYDREDQAAFSLEVT